MVCGRGLRSAGASTALVEQRSLTRLAAEPQERFAVRVGRKSVGAPAHLGIELQIFLQTSCNSESEISV